MRDVRKFFLYAKKSKITRELVLKYKAYIKEIYSASSVNSILASLNSFFRFIGREELSVKHIKTQKMTYCAEKKEITRAEYISLVKTARQKGRRRLGLILQVLCALGLRVSEIRFITAEAVLCGQAEICCKNKIRTVFIVRPLRKMLISYMKEQKITSGQLFVTRSGKELDRSNIWREMKSLCTEANVEPEKVFPHNLRHLFARTFYEAEKDIAKLADILGHSSINTTRIYIISTGAEHSRKMEKMRLVI